jgi:hypothetical protein
VALVLHAGVAAVAAVLVGMVGVSDVVAHGLPSSLVWLMASTTM